MIISWSLLLIVPPLRVEVNSTVPLVGAPLTVTCTAEFPPDVPRSLYLRPISDSPPFVSNSTVDDGTTRTIQAVVEPVGLNSVLQYICIAEAEGEYVYTRPNSSSSVIELTPICKPVFCCGCNNCERYIPPLAVSVPPTLVEEVADNFFVLNSSNVRSGDDSDLLAAFRCIVDSQPPATIEWSYFNNSRITIETVQENSLRQISTLGISSVDIVDQGVFTCTATSPYGSISSSANLRVFGELA